MCCLEGNDALKRLKLGADFQYKLNPKGSTPIEVLEFVFKSTVGPMLESFAKKHISKDKLEQSVDDCEFVTKQDKLVNVPRSPNVDKILKQYLEYRSDNKDDLPDNSVAE
ncbi:hypothetical protein Droror1_Dr00025716, partial [Drosera rotundifolia]